MSKTVLNIYISEKPGNDMKLIQLASVVAGKGIDGDRYFYGEGTFSERLKGQPSVELTLIEKEEIDQFNTEFKQQQGYGDFRRNIITTGVRLNELVDQEFSLGEVKLKGIRLCEPCDHLAKIMNPLVLPHMIGLCGLRAQILSSGTIRSGESIIC